MAELIIKKWQCDRCGEIKDARPKRDGLGTWYEVRASVDYETAGGGVFHWKDMCRECNDIVGCEITAMKASAARKEPT